MKTFLVLDWETFSEAEIKKCGAWEYSLHPSTEILCGSFRLGTKAELAKAKTHLWMPKEPSDSFGLLLRSLLNPEIELVAHNALFEQVIVKNVFSKLMRSKPELRNIPVERWHCTAAMSRSIGIPGNLEGAGAALGLRHQKDKEGHKLMLKVCKPKKPSAKDARTRYDEPELIARLAEYCKRDVDAEVELFLRLPELHPMERKFWVLDQKINLRGFQVDRELAKGALHLINLETREMDKRVNTITRGRIASARQRNEVLKFLRARNVMLPDLRAATVQEVLKKKEKIACEISRELLSIRDSISRSSTAKYAAFEIRSRSDGRARDNTIFFGAHTGRQSGTGLQPQNLFKTVLPQADVDLGTKLIRRKDVHTIRALFDKPMELYASALRSCIIAPEGNVLDVGDFATIEVRVLFWLAGHTEGLKALAEGRDLYCEMAGKVYHVDAKKLRENYKAGDKDALFKRQLGKQTVLGAGFGIGLGGEKFQATCKQYGIEISKELAQTAIRAYRDMHPRVPIFWTNLERAATLALQNPGKAYKLGYLTWQMEKDFLTVKLPIGRKLYYYKPRLIQIESPWGPKLELTYLGVESVSKKFVRLKTWGGKLTENCVQAVARDLLMESLLRIEESGKRLPVLAVHDEIVSERGEKVCTVEAYEKLMAEAPAWAKGLPVKVEGWAERRYRK